MKPFLRPFILCLQLLLGATLFVGSNAAYAQAQDKSDYTKEMEAEWQKKDNVVQAIIDDQIKNGIKRKKEGYPDGSIEAMGLRPLGCGELEQAALNTNFQKGVQHVDIQTRAEYGKGKIGAAEAGCFNNQVTDMISDISNTWKSICAAGAASGAVTGELKSVAKCTALQFIQGALKKLGEKVGKELANQARQAIGVGPAGGACPAWAEFLNRQISQCIRVGVSVNIQLPQFRVLRQCIIQVDARANLNANFNSLTPFKDTFNKQNFAFGVTSPMLETLQSDCGGLKEIGRAHV